MTRARATSVSARRTASIFCLLDGTFYLSQFEVLGMSHIDATGVAARYKGRQGWWRIQCQSG